MDRRVASQLVLQMRIGCHVKALGHAYFLVPLHRNGVLSFRRHMLDACYGLLLLELACGHHHWV